MFKFLKKSKGQSDEYIKKKWFEGANAIFAFLDMVLPDHDPEDADDLGVTAQVFLVFYIIGMAKSWCQIMELKRHNFLSQKVISYIVIDGLYYRYNLEFGAWLTIITEFFDQEKGEDYIKYKFVTERIEQGRSHFFDFMMLKYIPHNPLNIFLSEWSGIPFFSEDENDNLIFERLFSVQTYLQETTDFTYNSYGGCGHRFEIDGILTKGEYEFIDLKITNIHDMWTFTKKRKDLGIENSFYLKAQNNLAQNPFIKGAYPTL